MLRVKLSLGSCMLSEPVIHLQLAVHLGSFDLISVKELTALFNSLWPSDAVGWHRSCVNIGSGNACCLTEPIHYLNQCGLPISDILWPLPESNFTVNAWITFYLFILFFYFLLFFLNAWITILNNKFENFSFKIIVTFPRDQWVYTLKPEQNSDELMQERRNSVANALELRLFCMNPSVCPIFRTQFSTFFDESSPSLPGEEIYHSDRFLKLWLLKSHHWVK